MNAMKAHKVKTAQKTPKRGTRAGRSVRPEGTSAETTGASAIELSKIWQQEVQALRTQRFESVDAAVRAVVEQVVQRLGGDEEMKEFALLLCQTDPTMLESVESLLVD